MVFRLQCIAGSVYLLQREIFLLVVAAAVVVLVFRMGLYRERTKSKRVFLPLAVYSGFTVLSAIFSDNPKAAWLGGFVSLEGAFVLIGYCVIAFYTYQILEQESDYRSIMRAVRMMFVLQSVVGWFQVCKHDLLNYEWVQRLVMPDALFAEYGGAIEDVFTGNNVFLTLYNPNFAAIFLVMFAAVFAVFSVTSASRKERIIYGIYLVDAMEWNGHKELFFLIDDYSLEFAKLAAGYYYETEWGKEDLMVDIPHVDFHGLEYLGSGRLYIWSRILPMLKNYIFVGSDPDTFAEVFPQNDYVGKMIYAESTARIMERAHNDFLVRWVQTGFLSLLALVVFYVLFFQ